jgi:hypothetical protein
MPPTAAPQQTSRPASAGRLRRAAWPAGWVLLALLSMALTYALLVIAGR